MDDAQVRTRLHALKAELERALAGAQSQGETVDLDQSAVGRLSRMDALQQQAMAQAQERRTELRLEQLGHALARLDNGVYGDCVECGEPIGEARLRARPETPFCMDCIRDR
ncbi:MAG: TraR/DksA C4-type zinc finger protein [Myxococcota bacterium]